jgi:hypothetical protein
MPKFAHVEIRSLAPYSASRMHNEPKLNKETHGDYDERTWREKANYNSATGEVYIPAMAFKQAMDDVAKMFSTQIPGKGKSTYTKHFLAGNICIEDVKIGVHRDEMLKRQINANADGVRGSGKRVPRIFPETVSWSGTTTFLITDDTITKDIFETTLRNAGMFIGVGRFRRQKGGQYGAFEVAKLDFQEVA